ncbi:MAG: protein TolR [Rhodospirillales bacterium]
MAGSLQPRNTASRGRARAYKPMSEINVTPFVDVMLVLLIVFMVAAPLLTVGVQVDLPKTEARPIVENVEPLVVSVQEGGQLFIQETEVPADVIVARLRAITDNKADTRIFVRGDSRVSYGKVMEVMGMINAAGFSKVALVTLPREGAN